MNHTKDASELPACPVETTLSLIGDKWKVLILRDLMPGTKRFGAPSVRYRRRCSPLSFVTWRKTGLYAARYMRRCRREWSIP